MQVASNGSTFHCRIDGGSGPWVMLAHGLATDLTMWDELTDALKGSYRVLRYDAPFNFSAINNFAVREARGELVGLLNNDLEVITPAWLDSIDCCGNGLMSCGRRSQSATHSFLNTRIGLPE